MCSESANFFYATRWLRRHLKLLTISDKFIKHGISWDYIFVNLKVAHCEDVLYSVVYRLNHSSKRSELVFPRFRHDWRVNSNSFRSACCVGSSCFCSSYPKISANYFAEYAPCPCNSKGKAIVSNTDYLSRASETKNGGVRIRYDIESMRNGNMMF